MERVLYWSKRVGMLLLALVGSLVGAPVAFGVNEVTTTVLTNDEMTMYLAEKTLRTALFHMATYQFCEKFTLPKGEGRTFMATRYEHVNLPQNPAAQGVTPGNTAMVVNRVSCTVEQWVQVVTIPDVPLLSVKHPVLQKAIDRLSVAAAKTFERETQRVMMAGTNVQFANSKASRDLLVATDVLTSLEIGKAVTNLRKNGADDWRRSNTNTTKGYLQKLLPEGGGTKLAIPGMGESPVGLIGIVDPDVEQDLSVDGTFVQAASYSNIRALQVGELGKWKGVVWIRSNFMPYVTLLASPTVANANCTGQTGMGAVGNTDITVTRCSLTYGLEEAVSATQTVNVSNNSISVVLPAGATYCYRIYVGGSAGTRYLCTTAASLTTAAADDLTGPTFAANQTLYITAIPTSGDTSPVAPAAGVTVHSIWIFGNEAVGAAELDALQAFMTPAAPSDSDPAVQRRKVSWKAVWKSLILNQNFLRRIEAGSAFAG
jgi:N4-gp56 family major capsid protein